MDHFFPKPSFRNRFGNYYLYVGGDASMVMEISEMPQKANCENLENYKRSLSDKFILADNMKFRKIMDWWKKGEITMEERERMLNN